MKRLSVFGASGRTGLLLVTIAVERGYAVTAFCRDESYRQYFPESATCVVRDILNKEHLDQAVTGADVVICAFGPREPYRDVFCAAATGMIIETMKKHDVDRLLCVTNVLAVIVRRTDRSSSRPQPGWPGCCELQWQLTGTSRSGSSRKAG